MRAPLLEIKEKIFSFRGSADSSLAALQSQLKHRAQANEAREVSELLLDTFHVVSKSTLQGSNSLKVLQPPVINSILEALVEKSEEDLRLIKGITATFRMPNKPLHVFLEGERTVTYLTTEHRNGLLQGTASEITRRYYELASDIVSVARKTESSLQKIRLGAQRRAGASSDVSDNNVSDTDKICMQLFLDIQEYGCNLASLGVDATSIPAYCSLWQYVAPMERQSTISL
ncbi:conserved oligomeric Golgi complex subunit 2-like [Salvia divinorum]|uniref:Conserved oligomeric Golgi complex subunit 2-like n=1 Tax=Salvia divinorum TaxID=28513 RepID=A0ABD1ICS6_SALDI